MAANLPTPLLFYADGTHSSQDIELRDGDRLEIPKQGCATKL
jgi:hypothetical protein